MAKNRKVYSKEEIEKFKTDIISYDLWKFMDCKQQGELLNHYSDQFSARELSELWGIKPSAVHSHRYQLKKQGFLGNDDKRKNNVKKTNAEIQKEEKEILRKEAHENFNKQFALKEPKPQIIETVEEPIKIQNEKSDDVVVNIKDFMKILEIQEKMATMIEEQNQRKNQDGFSFNFKGDFTSDELTKRLNKIIAIIQDEPNKYGIRFELMELKKEDEKEKNEVDPAIEEEKEDRENELLQEVISLKENMEKLKKELEEQKEQEEQKDTTSVWESGYNALKSDKIGLHYSQSEYERNKHEFKGRIERNGKTLYQCYYVCPDCHSKGKHYVEIGTVYCNCKGCGKRMNVRDAVVNSKLTQDSFGNYYIAGKFKREDEKNENKSLYEIWNVQ